MSQYGSINHQVSKIVDAKFRPGVSRHSLKDGHGTKSPYIHSYKTRDTYREQGIRFGQWAKQEYGCRSIDQAKDYVNNWIDHMKSEGWTASSQKTSIAAICKIYGTSSKDYSSTDSRSRADIVRSRGEKPSDRNFSEKSNQSFVNASRSVGLRRSEWGRLNKNEERYNKSRGQYVANKLEQRSDGRYVLTGVTGKGGKIRDVPIIGPYAKDFVEMYKALPEGARPFGSIPSHADVHSYRADYANQYYREVARDVATLNPSDRYDCRGDRAGIHFDRAAMREVSKALGHNRIEVIAQHYLR